MIDLHASTSLRDGATRRYQPTTPNRSAIPTLEDWQHWTLVMGRAQQMMMEYWAESLKKDQPFPSLFAAGFRFRRAG